MKSIKVIVIVSTLLWGFLITFSISISPFAIPVHADGWYDSYGKIDWPSEREHLANLADTLRVYPNQIAYISFQWTSKKDSVVMRRRVERAIKCLKDEFGVAADRIVLVPGTQGKRSRTVIQPLRRGLPVPRFWGKLNNSR
jgi:hypothetical protein